MTKVGQLMLNQRGATLILTFIIMVTLVVIAGSYLFLVTYGTRNLGGQKNNVLAFYLAEAGLNKAIHYLLNTAPDGSTDGSWRTTAYPATGSTYSSCSPGSCNSKIESLGEGAYTIWVETSGSNIQVTVNGTANNVQRIIRQTITYSAGESVPEAFTYASFAGGNIDFSNSQGTAQVNGDIGAQGNIDQGTVPVSGDVDENSNVVIPSGDYNEYENIADNIVNGDKTFAKDSTSSGIWYVKGNVEIKQGATINGTIVAEGNVKFTGNNGTVTASSPYPAIVSQGNIEGDANNNLTITGSVFAEGNLVFNNCNNFTFSGSLVVDGNVELSSANNFNITFVSSNPPYFSGGEIGGGDPSINSVANSWGEI